MTKFLKPRPIRVVTANVNGDDVPHGVRAFDVMGVQEAGDEAHQHKIGSLYPKKEMHAPDNKQYHLLAFTKPRVFQVTKTNLVPVHPSGEVMSKSPHWIFDGKPYPVHEVPTPPRGLFAIEGKWFGEEKGLIIVGHRINIGPNQKCREWLAGLYDDALKTLVSQNADSAIVGLFDYNTHHPSARLGLNWVAGNGPDHIGAKGLFAVGNDYLGRVSGHSGNVHHKSMGTTLAMKEA